MRYLIIITILCISGCHAQVACDTTRAVVAGVTLGRDLVREELSSQATVAPVLAGLDEAVAAGDREVQACEAGDTPDDATGWVQAAQRWFVSLVGILRAAGLAVPDWVVSLVLFLGQVVAAALGGR